LDRNEILSNLPSAFNHVDQGYNLTIADMFSLREEHVAKSMQRLSSACGNTVLFK
jgi:hypothetical protein